MVNANPDKIIVLVAREGAKGNTGLVDNRIFKGQNKLHAVQDPSGLWSLHYDSGIMNEPLRQKYTSFHILLRAVKQYFDRRNIDVKEVIE